MTKFEQRAGRPTVRFADPEAVVADASLATEDKRAVLEEWRQQARSQPADVPHDPDLVIRIGRALAMLDTETGGHEVDHDQGFYTSVSDIGKR